MTDQEKKVKEMSDRYSVYKTDEQGRKLVYNTRTDNLTSDSYWVDKDGKTTKFNGW